MYRWDKKDFKSFEKFYRAKFFNSLTGYKPITLVGTQDLDQRPNLSIISSIVHLGANPPLIGFISRPHTVARHTLENIKETGHYTFNHVTESFYQKAHQTSARYDKNISEFKAVGLESEYLDSFQAPFVKSSPLKIAMKFVRDQFIPENETILVIGEVQKIYMHEKIVLDDGFIDIERLGLVCASSLDAYYSPQRLSRLSYAKPNIEPKKIPWK